MASVVGTLTYSCPELIERRPYTDKADIWSLGVILYQLLSLRNPFTDSNPLQTARKIVEGEIEAIRDPDNFYAPDLKRLIFRMMNPDTLARPDIIQVMEEINCWDKDLPQRDASRTDALDAAARPPQQRERRDPMDRCNDLYLETSLLQARIRTLEMEKERLESVVRAAAAGMGVPLTPHTPGSAYGRHFPQTPVGKSGGGQVRLSHFPQTPGGRTAGQTPAAKAARVGITGSSLRVPAAHVKEIDPASQMLNQLHKIVFVTQLPPDMGDGQANAQALQMRRAIEKYKRCLFGRYKTSGQGLNLKEELKKFLTNREEVIPLDFKDFNSAAGPSTTRPALEDKADGCRWDGKLTYHEMCNWIEVLLKENQYYESAAAELVVAPDVGLPEAVE